MDSDPRGPNQKHTDLDADPDPDADPDSQHCFLYNITVYIYLSIFASLVTGILLVLE